MSFLLLFFSFNSQWNKFDLIYMRYKIILRVKKYKINSSHCDREMLSVRFLRHQQRQLLIAYFHGMVTASRSVGCTAGRYRASLQCFLRERLDDLHGDIILQREKMGFLNAELNSVSKYPKCFRQNTLRVLMDTTNLTSLSAKWVNLRGGSRKGSQGTRVQAGEELLKWKSTWICATLWTSWSCKDL